MTPVCLHSLSVSSMMAAVTRSSTAGAAWAGVKGLFADEYEPMHRLAFVLLGSDSEAAEVVQDAFVAITPRLDSLDDVGADLRSEVVSGVRRRLAYRSAWQPKRGVVDERLSPRGGPGQSGSKHLAELVGELPEREHLAVVLRYYAAWATSDIGEALECPDDAVASETRPVSGARLNSGGASRFSAGSQTVRNPAITIAAVGVGFGPCTGAQMTCQRIRRWCSSKSLLSRSTRGCVSFLSIRR